MPAHILPVAGKSLKDANGMPFVIAEVSDVNVVIKYPNGLRVVMSLSSWRDMRLADEYIHPLPSAPY